MTSKGIRALRMVEPVTEQPESVTESAEPVTEQPTLEQLQEANKAIEVQIKALGAQLTGYNDVITQIVLETLVNMLVDAGVLDRDQFLLQKEARLNIKLSEAFGQIQEQALLRQRAEMRKQADLEVVKGPGLLGPRGQRLHG